jgi:hypothetical protein
MLVRFLCVFGLVLSLLGCNRQHSQQAGSVLPGGENMAAAQPPGPTAGSNPEPVGQAQAVSAPSGGQAMAATAPPPGQAAASNPEPVAPPPVEAVVPSESSVPAPPPLSAAAVLPPGTRIRVRLGQTLDTKHSWVGERFVAYLDAPVVTGGRVVVPKGTAFEGHVIESKSSGRLRGRAYLGVRLDSFHMRGQTYAIATGGDFRSSRSHKKRNLAIIGGGAGTGAVVGAVAGGGIGAAVGAGAGAAVGTTTAFITGKKNVRLLVETPLVFSLRGSVAVGG